MIKERITVDYDKILNRDLRRKLYMLTDTETTGITKVEEGKFNPFQVVFDFAYKIVDKQKNIYFERSYLVEEIFLNMEYMENAYYFSKYSDYLRKLANGEIILKKWADILSELYEVLRIANVDTIMAYNLDFDVRAINNTNIVIRQKDCKFILDLKKWDIYTFAVMVIGQQKTFKRQMERLQKFTASGKYYSTNAETMYQYITQNFDFEESHTALEDTDIELEIWFHCLRQKKKHLKRVSAPFHMMKR